MLINISMYNIDRGMASREGISLRVSLKLSHINPMQMVMPSAESVHCWNRMVSGLYQSYSVEKAVCELKLNASINMDIL